MRNVYLDYSATTPVKEEVLNEMRNRSSSVYEDIRQQVGDALFDAYTKNMNKGE